MTLEEALDNFTGLFGDPFNTTYLPMTLSEDKCRAIADIFYAQGKDMQGDKWDWRRVQRGQSRPIASHTYRAPAPVVPQDAIGPGPVQGDPDDDPSP